VNNIELVIFGLLFAGTAGAAFAFMWKSMSMLREEPRRRNRIHPEMENVKSGEELLVFNAETDDDGDEVVVIRK
tara:strand:+ start:347 stop:568 length:222 start_codon:yes stop_codon:yes gene_type:complete